MAREIVALGRPLGAGLALGALALAVLGAVAASWADLSAATEERDAKADLLSRGATASRRAAAAPPQRAADPFVRGDTATLAAAAVDADLRARAAAAGLVLLSSRADARPDEPGAAAGPNPNPVAGIGTRIEDQVSVEGQNDALQALLVSLETGAPTVLVDDLAIEPTASSAADPTADPSGGGPAAGDAAAPRLRMSLTLTAYWRPAGRPAMPR